MASDNETTETTTPTEGTDNNNQTTDTAEDTTPEEPVIEMIVEDGSCVTGANSYISLDDAVKYMRDHYRADWTGLDEESQKSSLIKATQYVDKLYTWKGLKKYGRNQVLNFPRIKIEDIDGYPINGIIPHEIQEAVCEAAYYGYQADLFSVYESESGVIKRDKKRVEGAVETDVEYFSNDEMRVQYISKYAALDAILRGLYINPNGQRSVNCKAIWSGDGHYGRC